MTEQATENGGSNGLAERKHEEQLGFATTDGGALRPANLAQAMELSRLLANSAFVPQDYQGKPGNVLAALQMGAEVGLAPMAALQNIAVINGRPSIWGDAALAVCKAHREWGGIHEDIGDDGVTCTVKRFESTRGGVVESTITRSFTRADAERAKLWGKQGPWQQYPKRMMQMRARAFALRDAFPDALRGLSVGEEAQDIVNTSAVEVTQAAAPTSTQKGAAGVKERLSKRKEPKPEGIDETAAKWIGHFNTAQDTDELSAIRRDLNEAWEDLPSLTQKAITESIAAASVRLAKGDQ